MARYALDGVLITITAISVFVGLSIAIPGGANVGDKIKMDSREKGIIALVGLYPIPFWHFYPFLQFSSFQILILY